MISSAEEKLYFRAAARIKGDQAAGTIFITDRRVFWTRAGDTNPSFNLPIPEIQSYSFSTREKAQSALLKLIPRGSNDGNIFEFLATNPDQAWKDRDAALNLIQQAAKNPVNQLRSAPPTPNQAKPTTTVPTASPAQAGRPNVTQPTAPVKAPITPVPSTPVKKEVTATPSLPISQNEFQQRIKLLLANEELRNLHEQLVKQGVITEDEFWESRKAMLQNEQAAKQTTGLPSALLADVRPQSTNTNHTYVLTPEVVNQIFKEYPGVEKLYNESVPHTMSETDFWTKYFQTLHFHREKNSASSTISTQVRPDERFLKVTDQDKLQEPILVKRKLPVDRSVDLGADDSFLKDYGAVIDPSQKPTKLLKSLSLIRRFNKHGAVVLGQSAEEFENGQRSVPPKPIQPLAEELKLTDLDEDKAPEVVPLSIEDSKVYFEARVDSSDHAPENGNFSKESLETFYKEIETWSSNTSRTSIPDLTSSAVLTEISTHKILKEVDEVGEISLPEDIKKQLYSYFSTSNELLRHFWSSFPITSQAGKQKLDRVMKSLEQLFEQINTFQNKFPADKRIQIKILTPISECLHKAFDKYDAIAKKN